MPVRAGILTHHGWDIVSGERLIRVPAGSRPRLRRLCTLGALSSTSGRFVPLPAVWDGLFLEAPLGAPRLKGNWNHST
jgi:hypothetical protein